LMKASSMARHHHHRMGGEIAGGVFSAGPTAPAPPTASSSHRPRLRHGEFLADGKRPGYRRKAKLLSRSGRHPDAPTPTKIAAWARYLQKRPMKPKVRWPF
jgi:hypothetical protein